MDKFEFNRLPPVKDTISGRRDAREMERLLADLYSRQADNPKRRRVYHNLGHVYAVANQLLTGLYPYVVDMKLFLYMAWFHDCWYDSEADKGENERMSGRLAVDLLTDAGLSLSDATFVQAGCLATTDHQPSRVFGPLIDADLSVLASSKYDYSMYVTQLREEYRWCTAVQWKSGRKAWIDSMLNREHIYSIPENRMTWGPLAVQNLTAERLKL